MKNFFIYSALVLSVFYSHAQNERDVVKGFWLNHEGNTVIEIYEADEILYGKIHKILEFQEDKVKNFSKEELAQGRERMKGRLILTDLSFRGGKWKNGKILDPKEGVVKAKCAVQIGDTPDSLELKITKGFFSHHKTLDPTQNPITDEN